MMREIPRTTVLAGMASKHLGTPFPAIQTDTTCANNLTTG